MTQTLRLLALATIALAPAEALRAEGTAAGPVAEIVTFSLAEGVSPAEFLGRAKTTEAFVRAAPGFLRRRLTQSEDGTWTDYVEWNSLAEAKAAAEALVSDPAMAPFLQAVDPASVSMRHETLLWALD
ncbi:MAG: hypothetical protein AAGF74_17915 [Pseudomonadota bacterium]